MKHNYFIIRTEVYLLFPFLILFFSNKWLLSWIAAAAIHEFGHLSAIKLLQIRVLNIEIGVFGAKIQTEPMTPGKELIVALAGPAGALLMLPFSRYIPQITVCILAQSFYNLLPVFPLDGGRAIRCLLATKMNKEKLAFAEKVMLYVIVCCCVALCIGLKLGLLPIILGISLLVKYTNANIPCKQRP